MTMWRNPQRLRDSLGESPESDSAPEDGESVATRVGQEAVVEEEDCHEVRVLVVLMVSALGVASLVRSGRVGRHALLHCHAIARCGLLFQRPPLSLGA